MSGWDQAGREVSGFRAVLKMFQGRAPIGSWVVTAALVAVVCAGEARAGEALDHDVAWPTLEQLGRVLSLRDYNTRVVVLGTMLLGASAGVIGSFMLLRKRALMGDALSHATLPGIALAFVVMVALGGDGKWLPGLLLGATVSGIVGMACILVIRNLTRLKEDAALGIVLSVFFGFGAALLGVIQKMDTGSQAGLESYIYGKTASMVEADVRMIAWAAAITGVACVALYKELKLLCFDQAYAASLGWSVVGLDVVMMGLVIAVTVIGLQAVGLILIIALLILPPTAARFWTENLNRMVWVSAGIGAVSGFLGAAVSALIPQYPAGATIVCLAAVFFGFSLVFGSARGVIVRTIRHVRLSRKVGRQHLLRSLYEHDEQQAAGGDERRAGMSFAELMAARSWSRRGLRRQLRRAVGENLVYRDASGDWRLTERGRFDATRVMRNHRLWEMYLITHADIAPSHVDRDADQIEHVLGREMISKLEAIMAREYPHLVVPPSPHG